MEVDMMAVRQSVVELAECIKDLVRIAQLTTDPSPVIQDRLLVLYKKASQAKNRMDT